MASKLAVFSEGPKPLSWRKYICCKWEIQSRFLLGQHCYDTTTDWEASLGTIWMDEDCSIRIFWWFFFTWPSSPLLLLLLHLLLLFFLLLMALLLLFILPLDITVRFYRLTPPSPLGSKPLYQARESSLVPLCFWQFIFFRKCRFIKPLLLYQCPIPQTRPRWEHWVILNEFNITSVHEA